jgi:hydrogenase maturation factor
MTVLDIDPARDLALCEAETGERASVEIALVEPVAQGDRLLVHAGTALVHL